MGLLEALKVDLRDLRSRELEPVTVAVVDSGVDATHPALAGRVVRAVSVEAEGDAHRIVDAGVPRNADVYGHGTAVAGIVAAIAPNARIVDVRVLDEHNVGSGGALVAGLRHATETDARVINMSLAAKAKFAAELAACCEAAYRRNRIVVAARRNMPLVDEGFPAELSSTIGVDAAKLNSQFEIVFREGHVIEFVAHGEGVVVPAAGGGSTTMTGTSFATPAVTGLCALLVGAHPDLRPFDVKSLLRAFST